MVAGTNAPLDSDAGKALIEHVRARSGQDGLTVLVGGYQATSLDLDRILYGHFPYAILFILVTTYLLLLITFRSVLLPLKAVLMDALSVAATFGVLVHLFQWGQLGLFPPVTFIGVGMAIAVLVDATIIRLLLVPATMRLLGRWNWWLPGRPLPPRLGKEAG